MSFTFSNNQEVDYPALGMCNVCGKRFTQGCEHSNTMEAQKWLAAYAAVETSRDNVEYFMKIAEETRPHVVEEAEFVDGFCFEDTFVDTGLNDDRPYRPGVAEGDYPF